MIGVQNQFEGAAMFSGGGGGGGGGFMACASQIQASQVVSDISPVHHKGGGRSGARSVVPLTVKQIAEALHCEDERIFNTNLRLLGLVENKVEKVTDVSFTLDDGTGRISIGRWLNDTSDAKEATAIQDGMYVKVSGNLKGFRGKGHATAFSVQPVTDFNDVALHFIECVYVHLDNCRRTIRVGVSKLHINPIMQVPISDGITSLQGLAGVSQFQTILATQAPFPNGSMVYQTSASNQPRVDGSMNHVYHRVLGLFQEPASLRAREHGLHVDEVARRLGLPMTRIMDAINYLVNVGHLYSTIDEYHFKYACNGGTWAFLSYNPNGRNSNIQMAP